MFEELAGRSGSAVWAVLSMLIFIGVWVVLAVRVARSRDDEMNECARLPLEDGKGN